jgi:DNA-binding protein WhiA
MALTKQIKVELLNQKQTQSDSLIYDCTVAIRFSMQLQTDNGSVPILTGDYDLPEVANRIENILNKLFVESDRMLFHKVPKFRRRYILKMSNVMYALTKLKLIDSDKNLIQGLPTELVTAPLKSCPNIIRNIFLVRGTASLTKQACSVDFSVPNFYVGLGLVGILKRLDVDSKVRQVRDSYKVSIRSAASCVKLLNTIGALGAAELFEEQLRVNSLNQDVNRITNFDAANLQRAANAAAQTTQKVKRAYEILNDDVPQHLREAGDLRISNPGLSLDELCSQSSFRITKHALSGRLRRLFEIANARAAELGIEGV